MNKKRTEQIRADFETLKSPNARFINNQMYIAAQVQNYLDEKGWSQKKLANESGLRASQISKIISAEANPTLKTISAIEKALQEDVIVAPDFFKEELEEQGVLISNEEFSTSIDFDETFSVVEEGYSEEYYSKEKNSKLEVKEDQNLYLYSKAS